jgi:TonB-linked SusC/RagA family outer membrane protein
MEFRALCNHPSYAPGRRASCFTKTLLVMKLTTILLLTAALHVAGKGTAQKVTYSGKSVSLQKVFSAIEEQTGYVFFYDKKDLADSRPVTVDLKDASLELSLKEVLAKQPLEFEIQGNTIFITQKGKSSKPDSDANLLNPPAPADVHGHITDSSGNPLVGASVTVKGQHKGTQTDANGNFSMKGVDNEATLLISFTGFESREIKLNGRSELTLKLRQGMTSIEDVVVNKGYYNTTNRLNTGDVTTVTGEDIQKQPVTDPLLALEGRVPGLYIQQASGVPGAYSTIRINGLNSIANGNDPLYIIDGVPFSSTTLTNTEIGGGVVAAPSTSGPGIGMSPFNSLNPADIESIEVLKDADATAIYGSRGANGVILITTRKGKAGDTRFDANVYRGAGKVTRMMDLLNTQQYLQMRHEAFNNDGLQPSSYDYDINGAWDTTRYTNWQKVLIGNTAQLTNAQVNLSGGNANTQFVIGGGYSKQTTVYPGDYSDIKGSVYFNLTHSSLDQRFHAVFSASYVNDNSNLPDADFTGSITLSPDAPALYDAQGNLNWQPLNGSATWNNPLAATRLQANALTDNMISNLNLSYQLVKGLQIKSSFGYTVDQMNQTILTPASSYAPPINDLAAVRSNSNAITDFKTWIIEPQADYHKKIGKGQLDLLAGTTFQENNQNSAGETASGFSSDALINDATAASTVEINPTVSSLYRYNAVFGRIGYNWNEEYLLNITARRDGSSRFGPGKQFGNFGAVGAGWIFSKEKAVQNSLPFLSFGKLRASYGSTGNDQIGDYQYLSGYYPYSYSYQSLTGLSPSNIPNPYFGWELIKKLEGGLELGFLKDHLLLTTSYYRNRTDNQLVGYMLPTLTGFTYIEANLPALIQNTGLEVSLNTINIQTKDFSWKSSANLTIPENKLVSYPDIAASAYANLYTVGQSLYSHKQFHYTGVDSQTGLYTFETKNAGGLPSYPTDEYPAKPVTQKFYGSIQNSFSYKGFQLDILAQYVSQDGYSYQDYFASPGLEENQPTAVLNRWRSPGNSTNIQRFGTTPASYTSYYSGLMGSDGVITGASFLRLKNLALSYQMPAGWRKPSHLKNARVYLQCQNLFTITKYLGLDPETGGLNLPPLRMITAGIQVGL